MTFQFNPAFPDATNEQKWEQIKLWRNSQLAASDWTMHTDAPTDKVKWATYRQALRDLPANNADPRKIELPTQPGGN